MELRLCKRKCFRIDSGVRQMLNHVPFAFQCVYGCSDKKSENGDGENGSDISGGRERVEIA